MARLDKNSLKLIVKECLIEILAEGLVSQKPSRNTARRKSALNESMHRSAGRSRNLDMGSHTHNVAQTQKSRPSYLDNIKFGQEGPTQSQVDKTEKLTSRITKDPLMQSILADTAHTTLREQVETKGKTIGITSTRPADKAASIVDQSDPSELFGESAKNWATLAFS